MSGDPQPSSVCGDGIIEGSEICDDGDLESDDGCNSGCVLESGWWCEGEPSVCVIENGFRQIAAGSDHACGLSANRHIYCWGGNEHGQLGNGDSPNPSSVPVRVASDATFVQVVTGTLMTCALTDQGIGFCWGRDLSGELGDGGGRTSSGVPVLIDTSPLAGATTFAELASRGYHSCALTTDGVPYCWGSRRYGEIGDGGPTTGEVLSPVAVSVPPGRYVHIAMGTSHTCVISDAGVTYCWGRNNFGQAGDGSGTDELLSPALVDISAVTGTFVQLTGGAFHTCGVATSGLAYCWGFDGAGCLGNGSATGTPVPEPVDASPVDTGRFSKVTVGYDHSCGLSTDGTAYCWGADDDGERGDGGSPTDASVPTPVDASAVPEPFIDISCGYGHTCALTETGVAYCWGENELGELGDASLNPSQSPVMVDRSTVSP